MEKKVTVNDLEMALPEPPSGNQVTKEKGKGRKYPNENEECYNSSEKLRGEGKSISYRTDSRQLY